MQAAIEAEHPAEDSLEPMPEVSQEKIDELVGTPGVLDRVVEAGCVFKVL